MNRQSIEMHSLEKDANDEKDYEKVQVESNLFLIKEKPHKFEEMKLENRDNFQKEEKKEKRENIFASKEHKKIVPVSKEQTQV